MASPLLPPRVLYAPTLSTHPSPGPAAVRTFDPSVSVQGPHHLYEHNRTSSPLIPGHSPASSARRPADPGLMHTAAATRSASPISPSYAGGGGCRRPWSGDTGSRGGPRPPVRDASSSDRQGVGGFRRRRAAVRAPRRPTVRRRSPLAPAARPHIRRCGLPCRADAGRPPEPPLSGRFRRCPRPALRRSGAASTEQDGRVTRLFLVHEWFRSGRLSHGPHDGRRAERVG